jgi:uncharacterized iron-regulated membrane protein
MQVIRKIHSLQYFGFWASCLIEIAAGWTIILLGTGIYLWWPRGRSGGVVTIRARPARRLFWRDLHAVTGALAAAVILFLAVTGMPWSQVWGARVQQWSTNAGLGEPRPPAQVVPSWLLTQDISPGMEAMAHHHMSEPAPGLPWAMERHATPPSPPHPGSKVIGIDAAIARFRQAGLPAPFTVTLPGGPRGAYVGSYTPGRAEAVRTMYLDQYTGQVIGDVGFRDYGPVAKAIEWGIQVHQGEEYGPLNLALMLSSCIAILLLAISSLVMWWKRRPAGALGIPPAPANPRHARIVLAIMVPVALLYPLVGASLLLALVVDQCVIRLRRKALLF